MNASFDMYKSVSSKSHKRDEVTHPVSAKLFTHTNSTFRGRDNMPSIASPARKSHTPLSVPATGSYRLSRGSLRDIPGPSSLVSLKYTGRGAVELKDIKLFKNLIDLDLSGNFLKSPIEDLMGLTFLKKLTISHNDLTELWPVPLQLETLVVSHNKLKTIGESVAKLLNLKVLDVSFNRISDCSALQPLAKLQTLNASNNEISSLEHFDKLTALKECDVRHNKLASWDSLKPLAELTSLEAVLLEGNSVLSNVKSARDVESIIQRLKFYPQYGLFCIDTKVRRRYEGRKSDRKPESVADCSSETSSDEDTPVEDEKEQLAGPVQPPTLPKSVKQPIAFKLDLSKCRFDRPKESPVELELKKQSAKGKRQPVVVPKLQLPIYTGDCLLGAKSSIRSLSRQSDVRRTEEKGKMNEFVAYINESLGLRMAAEGITMNKIKEALDEYREGKDLELEEMRLKCMQYKESLKVEKERNALAKDKMKLLIGEVNSLREKLRTNKENELAHKSLTSQLLAYQILHKKDMESKRQLNEELSKVQTNFIELSKKYKKAVLEGKPEKKSESKVQASEEVQTENERLKAKNEALTTEYKRLKEEMDETVAQLINKIKEIEEEKETKAKNSESILLSRTGKDKVSSFVSQNTSKGKLLTKNGNTTFAHLNETSWKECSGSIDLKTQGKLAKYIASIKKQNTSLNKELQYSLQQRKKLQEKLAMCTSLIQSMNLSQKGIKGAKKSLPGTAIAAIDAL